MYNLPDVYSTTTSTVPSTANLQVVAACSVWVDSVDIVFVGCCVCSCRMVQSTHTSWFYVLVEGSGDIRMSIDTLKSWLAGE